LPTTTAKAEPIRKSAQIIAQAEAAQVRCEAERDRVLAQPALPGTKELDANRTTILAWTKTEPVIFVQPPQHSEDVSRGVRRIRHTLAKTPYPGHILKALIDGFRIKPENGRGVLLRDGYLYADAPHLAFVLVEFIRAEHLFGEQRIWIQRGDQTYNAKRTIAGNYVYVDGPQAGKEVRLILFDRLGVGPKGRELHRDLRSLRYRLHFDRIDVKHVTEDRIVADLHYGALTVPSVLRTHGARVELQCEIAPPNVARDVGLYRDRGSRNLRVVQALRRAMINQIEERLPFDEPYREWGQQDGILRQKWVSLYQLGHKRFELNGDEYYVYDAQGRPMVPQVCVDFLTDTFERASGTWWRPRGQTPERVIGKLDFRTLEQPELRRVPGFLEYTRTQHDWFDLYDVPDRERVPLWKRDKFYQYLKANYHRYVPGDIVVIRGYTPFQKKWERPVMHYHSFFVYEVDPLTAMPIAIAGNAGRPSIRVWETEARRTPRRAIWHRIRPRLHWLETVVPSKGELDELPAPLSVGPL
jgi:hypothetical protein